jgi:PAS domain S-box-containing protein
MGNWVWDLESNVITHSQELYRIFEMDPDKPLAPIEERISRYSPESRQIIRDALDKARTEGTPFQVEAEFICHDGSRTWVRSRGEAIRDAQNNIVKLQGTVQDITDLRASEEAFRLASERLALAANAGGIGIWDWDVAHNRLTWDESMFRLYGWAPNQIVPSHEAWAGSLHPDDKAATVETLQNVLRAGNQFDAVFRIIWPDQSIHHIKATATVHRDSAGEPIRMIGTNLDISDLKKGEAALKAANDQAELTNRELRAFSYSVSHDLRAPLRGIDGWSLALLEDYADQLGDRGREYLARVRSEAQLMGRLIDDLLNLSRVTQVGMNPVRVDLASIARGIESRLRKLEPSRTVEFVIPQTLNVFGDSGLLSAAMNNFIENSWKFTSKIPNARIEVGRVAIAGEKVYFVRDNGAGFDMAYAQKLFSPFQRFHKASEFPGTGIGLATVQRIIHRHGGRLWAEAAVNQGATFYFTLEA